VRRTKSCWVWKAAKNDCGYGNFFYKNKTQKAHRIAYEIVYGKFQANLNVLHKCDNPACVRPDHLFLGTQGANMKDMYKKGRRESKFAVDTKGIKNTNAKLTNKKVLSIRKEYIPRIITRKALAEKYKVSKATIDDILCRRRWAWL